MSYTVTPAAVSGGAHTIDSAKTITEFTADAIRAGSATWQTAGVIQGDAVQVAGSTSNDGFYIVLSVRSETELEVYPGPTVEAAAGSATVRNQNHRLTIENEGPLVTAADIVAGVAAIDARLFFESDRFPHRVTSNVPSALGGLTVYKHLFRRIHFNETIANITTLRIQREVWASAWLRESTPTTLTSAWQVSQTLGSSGHLIFELGERDASDILATKNGAIMIGGVPIVTLSGSMVVKIYNAWISGPGNYTAAALGSSMAGQVAEISNLLIDGACTLTGPGDMVIRNLILSAPLTGGLAFASVTGNIDAQGILIASSTGQVTVAFDPVTLPGLTLSDDTPATPLQVLFAHLVLDDPGKDISLANVAISNGGHIIKRYTFNPRLITVNPISGPQPVAGLRVAIEKIPDGRYLNFTTGSDSEWIVTINGTAIPFTPGGTGLGQARLAAQNAINAAAVGVTATQGNNAVQWGGSVSCLIILSGIEDEPFTIELTQAGAGGAWTLDPTPGGEAAAAPDDIRPGPIPGSPFTTDANGRIATDGVLAIRAGNSETTGVRGINVQLLVTVEGAHYRTQRFVFAPRIAFAGDFPAFPDHMGVLS